jgi:hypothetical protein
MLAALDHDPFRAYPGLVYCRGFARSEPRKHSDVGLELLSQRIAHDAVAEAPSPLPRWKPNTRHSEQITQNDDMRVLSDGGAKEKEELQKVCAALNRERR